MLRTNHKDVVKTLACFALLALSSLSHATAILSTSGNITQGVIPSSLVGNATESTQMFVYQERQDLLLPSTVLVNLASSGTYAPVTPNPAATLPIATGTTVTSYLFHLDPPGTNLATIATTVTFDGDILGIITSLSGLTATDAILGAIGTTYETVLGQRGMEPGSSAVGDSLNVSANLRTLSLNFGATTIDEIRVLVAPSNHAPEPGTMALLSGGLLALARLRRRA